MEQYTEKTLEQEQAYLADVQQIIGQEIEARLEDLSDMKQDIVDYRRFLTEEIPINQIGVMDQDNPVRVEKYKSAYERLFALSKMYYAPYFGMIHFKDPLEPDDEIYYIGRRGLDNCGEPMILDWRTPVASLFYQGRLGTLNVKAPGGQFEVDLLNRRQYMIRGGQLKGMFDSEIDIKDDILQMVLSSNSGSKLKDAIATLQKEQDDIIREPLEHHVMIDGVAGSGKTTIILHRVAYLLYNYRSRLKNNILIVGPNRLFMDYISDVLPDMGEKDNTFQMTLPMLTHEILKLKHPVMSVGEYYRRIGEHRKGFDRQLKRKSSASFKRELDEAIRSMEESCRAKEDFVFQDHVLITADERNQLFEKTYGKMPYVRKARKFYRVMLKRLKDLRDRTVRSLNKAYAAKIHAYKKKGDSWRAEELKNERDRVIHQYFQAAYACMKEIRALYPVHDVEDWYAEFVGQKESAAWTEDDLAGILYVYTRWYGTGSWPARHLVIDEAQDVSAFQFQVLKMVTGAESYTIVGDRNQRVKGKAHISMMDRWEKLMRPSELKNVRYFEMKTSYRSTPQIMRYAEQFLPRENHAETIDREGTEVEHFQIGPSDGARMMAEAVLRMQDAGMERIGILCGTAKEADRLGKMCRRQKLGFKVIRSDTDPTDAPVVIMPVFYAKGLEYDGVVVYEFKDSDWEPWTRYILCTRALHRLTHLIETDPSEQI